MTKHIGRTIKCISNKMNAIADQDLKSRNLTISQARVLKFVSRNGGCVTQKAVEEYLGVSHPTAAGIVSRMEKAGFIKCCADENDRRNKNIMFTTLGEKTDRELKDNIDVREQRLLSGLDEDDRENLLRMLEVIYSNLERAGNSRE